MAVRPGMCGLVGGSGFPGGWPAGSRWPAPVAIGYAVMGAPRRSTSLNLLLPPGLPWSVLPIFIYTRSACRWPCPCLSIFALDPFRLQRGLAASCQTFFQSGFNGLAAR